MASMVIGGLFNAFAFAGAGYLFKALDGNKYTEEIKRHNRATEKLTKAREKFYEAETKRHDRKRELQEEIRQANSNMEDTSKAFSELNRILKTNEEIQEEPQIEDYYSPSPEMRGYKIAAMTIAGSGLGFLLTLVV